jgi:O-antigen/teichoic acid export membrane protein
MENRRSSTLHKLLHSKSESVLASYNILATVITAGIAFFTIPVFTRLLDTSSYGTYSLYNTWVQIFAIFVGLRAEGSVGPAQANLPEDEQDAYQFSVLLMSCVSFTAFLLLAILFGGAISEPLGITPELLVCVVVQSYGVFLVNFFNMRYIFKKQARRNFVISVLVAVSTTSLSIVLILLTPPSIDPYWGRVIGYMLPYVAIGVSLFVTFARKQRASEFSTAYWRFCLPLTIPLIFHGLSLLILAQSDQVIIKQFYDASAVGIYSLAVTISNLLNSIYRALNNAYVPFLYEDFAGKSAPGVKERHFDNYMRIFTTGTCAFLMLAPEVLKIMSDPSYWPAISVLPMLIVGQYCVFLYSFPVNYEFYRRQTRTVAFGTVCAAILNIVLNYAFIPSMSYYGAALATMVSYVGLFAFHYCSARFMLGDHNFPLRKYLLGAACVGAAVAIYYPLRDLVVARWAIGLALVVLMFGGIIRRRTIF